jgi:hypothetical protein
MIMLRAAIAIAGIILGGLPGFGRASEERLSRAGGLTIKLRQKTYVVGEPIVVDLELRNGRQEGETPFFAGSEDFSERSDFLFSISRAGGPVASEVWVCGTGGMRLPQLARRSGVAGASRLWKCRKMFVAVAKSGGPTGTGQKGTEELLGTGRYELCVKMPWLPSGRERRELMTSNVVEFEITEAVGADREAAELMGSAEAGLLMMGSPAADPSVARTLVEKYPTSTHARYARGRLLLLRQEGAWGSSGVMSDRKRDEVTDLVSEGLAFVGENKDMCLNESILLYSARLSRALGRDKESVGILNRIIVEYPESSGAEAARRQLESWTRQPVRRRVLPAASGGGRVGAIVSVGVVGFVVLVLAGGVVLAGRLKLQRGDH